MSLNLTISLLELNIVGYIAIAIIVHIAIMGLSSIIYVWAIRHLGEKVDYKGSFIITNLGDFIHYFAPFKTGHLIGKPLVGRFLKGIPIHKTLSATAFEQFLGLLWMTAVFPLLLILQGEDLIFTTNLTKWIILLIGIIAVGVIAYHYNWFIPQLVKLKKHLPKFVIKIGEKLGITETVIEDLISSLPKYFKDKPLLTRTLIIILIQAAIAPIFLWCGLNYFNVSFSYPIIFSIYWVSFLIGRISFLPAGIGVKDVTLAGLLVGLGVAGGTTIKIIIVYRLLSLIPPMLIGGGLTLYYGNRLRKYKSLTKLDGESNT